MKVTDKEWSHEDSYKGLGISTFIHRARLKKYFQFLVQLIYPKKAAMLISDVPMDISLQNCGIKSLKKIIGNYTVLIITIRF